MDVSSEAVGTELASEASWRDLDLGWVWIAAAFLITAAAQLGTQLGAGRLFGAAEYSEAATLLVMMNLVGIPMVAAQLLTTSAVARGASALPAVRRQLCWGAGLAVGAVLTAPLWSAAFAIPSLAACAVASLFLPVGLLLCVARGNAIGQARSRAFAVVMSSAAALRLALCLAGAAVFGVPGLVGGVVVAEAVHAVVLLMVVRPRQLPVVVERTSRPATAATAQVSMWLAVNADLLWARRLLEPEDAGRYLVVSAVTVGLVSFGQAILWHRASSAATGGARVGMGIVARATGIVAACALLVAPLSAVMLPWVLGPTFADLGLLIAIGCVWAVLASVVHTSTATQIIRGGRSLRRLIPAAALSIAVPPVALAIWGQSAVVLAVCAVVDTFVGAVVVALPQFLRARSSTDGPARPAHDPNAVSP